MALTLKSVEIVISRTILLISSIEILIYISLYIHHHYFSPHIKAPTLWIPWCYIAPLFNLLTKDRSSYTFEPICLFAIGLYECLSATRADGFCYWVGFDKVCWATEVRYRLAQTYTTLVLAQLGLRAKRYLGESETSSVSSNEAVKQK
ncbi:hypothetical protein JCM5353_006115 [Sporobolomyces roseus]